MPLLRECMENASSSPHRKPLMMHGFNNNIFEIERCLRNDLRFQKILAGPEPLETACPHAVKSTDETINGLWADRLQNLTASGVFLANFAFLLSSVRFKRR